jgi:FkbM family methyltransferase
MLSKIFQHAINNYINKKNKFFYFFYYSLLKNLTKTSLILPFQNYKFYASTKKKDLSKWMVRNLIQWDKRNIEIIIKLIKKYNSTFVDCGCNFGAYSIPIARKFKNNVIYSIDASEEAINSLKKNINLNKIENIKCFNLGIGEKNEIKYFEDNINKFSNSGSYRFVNNKTQKKIKLFKLDYLYEKKLIKIKKKVIIKIDIEGYDFLALKGMKKILKKFDVIVFFEFSKLLIKNSKNFKKELINFIKKNKLILYDLNFKEKNVNELVKLLNKVSKKNETIGDYIITNWKFSLKTGE